MMVFDKLRKNLSLEAVSQPVAIILVYSLSYGLMLFNQGLFWEDWAIFNHLPADNIVFFRDLGYFLAWPGYLYAALSHSWNPVLFARALVFLSFLASALFLNKVLESVREIRAGDRLAVSLLFAMFPFFTFRFAYGTLHYSLSYAAFFAGFWCLRRYFDRPSAGWRVLALLLFFFACTTRSFLVFYLLPALYVLYRANCALWPAALRFADLFVLPVLVFVLNRQFFPPLNEYAAEGYNAIQLKRILLSPLIIVKNFAVNVSHSFNAALGGWAGTAGFFAAFLAAGRFMPGETAGERERWTNLRMLALGLLCFAAGAFPYIAIGKNPLPGSVDRFQLLIPLGAAMSSVYGFKLLFRAAAAYAQVALILLFAWANLLVTLDHQRFWYKKVSLMENMRISREVREGENFFVQDNAIYYHTLPLDMAFYEYSGFFRLIYGDQTRTAYYQPEDLEGMRSIGGFRERYNLKDYKPSDPKWLIRIEPGALHIGRVGTLALLIREYLSPETFKGEITRLVRLEFERVSGATVLRPAR